MKNYFFLDMIIIQTALILSMISCQNSTSLKQGSDSMQIHDTLEKSDTSHQTQTSITSIDTSIISKITGGWCYVEKDTSDSTIILKDFSLTLVEKGDSLFGEYNYVFANGRHLNSSDGWSFKIRKEIILDSSTFFPFENAYDYTTLHLKFEYDRNNDVLKWKIKEPYDNNKHWLPNEINLHRCEPDKTNSLK
ncbi:MAG: hypothetical protein PW786_10285 [Arachidicoccus sp.]|nr:hypothetical protein [Arachidicoccus sp.]